MNSNVFHGVGRRKSSVARVWLRRGNGGFKINGIDYQEYLDTNVVKALVEQPLKVTGLGSNYDIEVNVCGGGIVGQAGAIKLGVARALLSTDESLKPVLKKHKLLHCDSRLKERKKYGRRGARRRFQFVKR